MRRSLHITMCALIGASGCALPGMAADLADRTPLAPQLFDVAFGVAGVTDYRFRGVTNSAKDPAIQGYAELGVADWAYVGVWSSSVALKRSKGWTDPSAEIDIYGGVRHRWGPVLLDVGALYYWYPGEKTAAPGPDRREIDYWELYAKPSVAIGQAASISVNAFWTSDFINTGSDALYLSVIPKVNIPTPSLPALGFYVSGEFGKQWLGRSTVFPVNLDWKNYFAWNAGGGVTYKAMTLDVRYSDTSLSRSECAFNIGARDWCGSAVVAKLSFDASLSSLR